MTMLLLKEVAERYRVSRRTVYRWRKMGLRCARVGRVVRYHVDDVDAFLRANTTTTLTSGADSPPTA
jgi:excisionase family DNA binding protein